LGWQPSLPLTKSRPQGAPNLSRQIPRRNREHLQTRLHHLARRPPNGQAPTPAESKSSTAVPASPEAQPKTDQTANAPERTRTSPLARAFGLLPPFADTAAKTPPALAASTPAAATKDTPKPVKKADVPFYAGCSGGFGARIFGVKTPQAGSDVPHYVYFEGTGPNEVGLGIWLNVYATGQRWSYMFRMVPDEAGNWAFPLGLGRPDDDYGATSTVVFHLMTRAQEIEAGLEAGTDKPLPLRHWSSIPGRVCNFDITRESREAARAAALVSPFKN
jgi:hypothetical protein